MAAIGPGAPSLKTVSAEASPQSTVTCQGSSSPGSVKQPSANELELPSLAVWLAAAVTTGGTLATVTWKVAEPLTPAPASSSTVTVTVKVPSSA